MDINCYLLCNKEEENHPISKKLKSIKTFNNYNIPLMPFSKHSEMANYSKFPFGINQIDSEKNECHKHHM